MTVPDWKKKDDYPPIRGTSPERWAYEFLRRNPEFDAKIEAANKEPVVMPDIGPIGWSQTPVGKVLVEYGVDYPMLQEWIGQRISDSPLIFKKHPRHIPSYKVEKSGGLFTDHAIGKRFHVSPSLPELVALEFDLAQPINPQIARAKAILKASQGAYKGRKRAGGKSMVNLYPFYLRVLDAYAAAVPTAKICEVLSVDYRRGVGDDTLRNWKLEAERLRDGGYLEIVKNPKP